MMLIQSKHLRHFEHRVSDVFIFMLFDMQCVTVQTNKAKWEQDVIT